jgi:hypothetical protein
MIARESLLMAGDDLPLDLEGLLALLERLDGVEEAAVVRSALEAGVPREPRTSCTARSPTTSSGSSPAAAATPPS